jgi:glycosyltransferase involved in cell wall biosynthesis
MKIAVYAIAKNEAHFVERFCKSAAAADLILIADTGSTDGLPEVAAANGAQVHRITINPWRFDHARNAALALVPSDIDVCVSLDIDEVLEPGWREEIEKLYTDGVNRIGYMYQWSKEVSFYHDKVHARNGFFWKYPCHECLYPDPRVVEKVATTLKVLITHHPDLSKDRKSYLDLLRAGAKEMPHDQRALFYYARELYYQHHWDEVPGTGEAYLNSNGVTWVHERAYMMRAISTAYMAKQDAENAVKWAQKAIEEIPYLRDGWMHAARVFYGLQAWESCYKAAVNCLGITRDEAVHTKDPSAWSWFPYDLAALAAYHLGKKDEAVMYGEMALEKCPGDSRLIDNLAWYKGEKK